MTPAHEKEELLNGIAIVGMSGRFPGANNLDEFWRNLRDGVESVSFFSDDDLRRAGVDPAVRRDPDYVGAGGVLAGVDLFDAGFFGFNPREAEAMDPQHRIFLETAWEALENAGYDPAKYPGSIGVYAGTGISTYFFNIYDNKELLNLLGGHQVMIGNDKDHLTTHASYKFDLRGPSVTVQTACSTSLVAVCMACRSLLDYQCDMALAGGSSVAIPQGRGYFYREGGISSPDGHCRAFDSEARGTVTGNGAGVVLLKRLSDAIADGDTVRAVIRGSAVNNDGAVKVGYTAPSVDGQAEVVAMAQATAGVGPETITFIEAHGTGTPLGDPIEVAALAQVFAGVNRRNYCAIGSVKSNIGHLDTAAGIAGLIKAVLAIENKRIPASLHFNRANPKLNLERTPFYISDRTHDWRTDGTPRRAGVSSFGIGGTNAHVVLEEAPAPKPADSGGGSHLITLSARSGAALEALTQSWVDHFRGHPDINVADAAFTSAVGRKEFRYRRAAVCRTSGDVAETLSASRIREAAQRDTAFLFSGQGSQYSGMTWGLYRDEPAFREQVDRCLAFLKSAEDLDLYPVLYPASHPNVSNTNGAGSGVAEPLIGETEYTQPALFVIEYALARLLIGWGIKPSAMAGHSIGEYTAACVAGVWSLEDALHVVRLRGRLMQSIPRGSMLAAPLSESEAQRWLRGAVSLAAINSHDQAVFSGPEDEILRIAEELRKRGIEAIPLRTSHAFHSGMMDPIIGEFERAVRETSLRAPSIPFVSNVTGDWITDAQATDPAYWSRHLRAPVRFAGAIEQILARPAAAVVEVGPGQTLAGLVRRHARFTPSTPVFHSVRGVKDRREDRDILLSAVGGLWTEGAAIDWNAFYGRERRSRIPLPAYPFERKRYWIDPPPVQTASRVQGRTPSISDWFYIPQWKRADPLGEGGELTSGNWLVLSEGELGSAIADRIRRRGGAVTTLDLSSNRTQESLDSLIARCAPDAIVHCWLAGNETRSFDEWQELGFHSLLRLTRSLTKAARPAETIINVVSRNIHSVMGNEQLEPAKAAVLGPCKVIPQEHPGIRIRSIDLDTGDPGQIVDSILREIDAPLNEPVVAFRNGRRWLPVFEHARWDEATDKSLLRRNGVYLITGGFGNVGITMAETMARHFAARIALVGRTPLPPESEWDGCNLESVRAVRELRALGAEVIPICGDSANAVQMRAAVDQVVRDFGRLDGVIHAAAEMDLHAFQPALATDTGNAERHFRNKAKSALVLRDIFSEQPIPFCMLVSSLSSVLGGLTFSAYAGANAVLDCLAEQQNRGGTSTRWISVNWDGWRFTGEQPNHSEYYLAPDEGASAFRRIFAHSRSAQVVVSTGDLEARLDRWVRLKSIEAQPNAENLTPAHPRPEVTTQFAAPQTAVEQMIADVWQLVLGVNSVGIHDNFFELGGHSLLAIQLVSRLRDLFQAEIAITAIFDHPTLTQLAAHVQTITGNGDEQMERLAQMLDYVEQLSPEEVEALLAGDSQP
jgi:acyl transferase domain-containing protein/acyl carrier protein